MTDAELVAACRTGDEDAWAQLVRRHARYVSAILRGGYRLGDADAEEVFQEVYERAYTRLESLRDPAALRPWLAQLARRAAVDRLRRNAREDVSDEVADRADAAAAAELERLELALTVRAALAELPEHCREIVDRFFACDESYHVIGAALGIPAGTIASRISRCLAKLRAQLGGRNSAAAGVG